MRGQLAFVAAVFAVTCSYSRTAAQSHSSGYYGKHIGKLKTLHHGVTGDVYAVDARTLHIRDFNYDGAGPAAYFYAGNSKSPSSSGFQVSDEKGTKNVLSSYRNKHITITLPEGKTLHNIKWLSVWCEEFSVNFGDVKIPKNLDYPKPQKIEALNGVHKVSSEPIVVVDAQTLLIPGFSYDGEAPDAKFWVGRGNKPSPQGVRVPDENGKEEPLRKYDQKTIVLTLPGDLTIFDIGHFGVWCEAFTVDFGHIRVPRGLNAPPSLKMLGVSPQKRPRSPELSPDQFRTQHINSQEHLSDTFVAGHPFGDGSSPANYNNYNSRQNNNNNHNPSFSSHSISGTHSVFNNQYKVRATTYKPTFNIARKIKSYQDQQQQQQQQAEESFQIVPSISFSSDTDFAGQILPQQTQYQPQYEYQREQDQYYHQSQESPVVVSSPGHGTLSTGTQQARGRTLDGSNRRNTHIQRSIEDTSFASGRSFSHFTLNGHGGDRSDTFVHY